MITHMRKKIEKFTLSPNTLLKKKFGFLGCMFHWLRKIYILTFVCHHFQLRLMVGTCNSEFINCNINKNNNLWSSKIGYVMKMMLDIIEI
jgi:hypothetical protein